MVYSVIIDLGFTIVDIDYPCKFDKKGNTLRFITEMYKGKTGFFKDPRLQGNKGTCLAIMCIYPDTSSKLIYNNGWEREN